MFTRASDTSLEEKLAGPAFIFEKGEKMSVLVNLMELSVSDFFQKELNQGCAELLGLYDSLKAQRISAIEAYYSMQKVVYMDDTSIMIAAKNMNILDVDLVSSIAMLELSKRGEVYFAFGSNMDRERLRKRCPSARFIAVGVLRNYKLIFNILGNKVEGKGGGIANIQKSTNSNVHGVLYRLDKRELAELTELESSMNYDVEVLDIHVDTRMTVKAEVYIGSGDNEEQYKPTAKYRQFIVDGMKMHNFPQEYQEKSIGIMDK